MLLRWSLPLNALFILRRGQGLVFGSNLTSSFALDVGSGNLLWRFETGGIIDSNPIAYLSEGKQYVVIAAGHSLLVFGLD
jgi:hypothetical protein